jgi:hypothetical protein
MAQHSHHDEGARARETLVHPAAHVTHHHEPGTMDITAQERTFVGFIRFSVRMTILVVIVLLLLAVVNAT